MNDVKVVIETPAVFHWIAVPEDKAAELILTLAEATAHALKDSTGFLYVEYEGEPAVIRADQVLAIFIADEEDDL